MSREPDFRTWEKIERRGLLEAIQRMVPEMKGLGSALVRTTLVTDYSAPQRYLVVDGWVELEGGMAPPPKFGDLNIAK